MTDPILPRSVAAAFELFLTTQPDTLKLSARSIDAMRHLFYLGAMAHSDLMAVASTLPEPEAFRFVEDVAREIDMHFVSSKRSDSIQ
jgi:hypothetical protein